MEQLNLKKIGSFVKTHGVHGQLVLNLADNFSSDFIENALKDKEAVFVELDGIPVPFFISENGIRSLNQSSILLKLDEINDKKAIDFCGCDVWIESDKLDGIAEDNLMNIEDCIGFQVYDYGRKYIGEFVEFINLKGNPLLRIDVKGKELLIPLISDFIKHIDTEKDEIHLQLPDDYVDALLQD